MLIFVIQLINGEDNVFKIYDNLDSEITTRVIPLRAGNLLSISNDEVIPQLVNGLKRNSLNASATKIETFLFYYFPPAHAYLLNYVFINAIAFLGIFLLFSVYIFRDMKDQNKLIASVLAFTFVMLRFYTIYGMAVLGAPLLLYSVLNILKGRKPGLNLIYVIIYPFNSSLVLGGFVVVGLFFVIGLGYYFSNNRVYARKLIGISVLLGFLFVVAEINLFNQFFFDKTFVSHRTAWDPTFDQMTQGAETLGFWGALDRSRMVLFEGEINDRTYPDLIALFFLFMLVFNFRAVVKNRYIRLIAAILIVVSLIYGFYFSDTQPLVWLKNQFILLKTFRIDRFFFFIPVLWYVLFALLIKSAFDTNKRWMKIVAYVFLFLNMLYVPVKNRELKANIAIFFGSDVPSMVTWKRFFAEDLFDKIKKDIGEPLDSFRVVSIGVTPAVAQYNGFYTLDIYSNNYPLEYKKQFRKIIAPELEKSAKWKASFDKWGGECFIFSSEIEYRPDYIPSEKVIRNLQINTEALYNMGGRYVLSAVEIENYKELNLKFLKKYTDGNTPLAIYLYKVLPPSWSTGQ